MGEHHDNLMALLAATLPQFPPVGRETEGRIGLRVAPKRDILLLTRDSVREVEGETQVRQSPEAAWEKVPDGLRVHVIGERLKDEDLDVVFALGALWVDTSLPVPGGRAGIHFIPGEITRVDYRAFLQAAERSLPEERRIIAPGLKVVKE